MEDYNYKVVAELKDDLTDCEREDAESRIHECQRKYKIIKIDEKTYCKAGQVKGVCDDFGAVTFFYCMLKRMKEVFSTLEYYDLSEGEKDVAV